MIVLCAFPLKHINLLCVTMALPFYLAGFAQPITNVYSLYLCYALILSIKISDPEEFLNLLFKEVLHINPFLSIK